MRSIAAYDNDSMDTVLLADGDIHWVFPTPHDPRAITSLLRRAAAQMDEMACGLPTTSTTTSLSLSYVRLPTYGATANLWAYTDCRDVTFEVELDLPRHSTEWTVPQPPPPWTVTSRISVRCDGGTDCGMHIVDDLTHEYSADVDAAQGLLEAAIDLARRASGGPTTSWCGQDPINGHL